MATAPSPIETDLAQLTWPFYLLELKSILKPMEPGQLLKAKVADSVALAHIQQIMEASLDRVLETQAQGAGYVLTIVKG